MTERDPHGKQPNEPGAKLDAGKAPVGLMLRNFPRALAAVAQTTGYGAKEKYTPSGWREVENGEERYLDALGRHLLIRADGSPYDPSTGLKHMAQAAWNSLAVLELELIRGGITAEDILYG